MYMYSVTGAASVGGSDAEMCTVHEHGLLDWEGLGLVEAEGRRKVIVVDRRWR